MTLEDVLAERGFELQPADRSRLVQSWHRLDPWPDVRVGLQELRAQRVVAALSNCNIALLIDLARHPDVQFDCLLSSELAGLYKPDPEVYLTAARLLRLDPSEVMMVAAQPGDLTAARAGWATERIHPPAA